MKNVNNKNLVMTNVFSIILHGSPLEGASLIERGWLVAAQAFFTMAFISSFGSQLILAFLFTHWSLSFILRYEWFLSFTCCIGNLAATFLIFLSVAIFGGQCYRRDWLPYPNYNYLSWGYVFAILSMSVHLLAGLVLYGESRASKGRSLPNGLGHRHADSDVQSDMVMQTRTLSPTGTEGMYSYSAASASPYWLVSWQYTFSPFKRMGLWEFCFDRYRHPSYQYDKLFSGCSYIFSDNFLIIREWLLPGWMVAVQAFFTMAFISSFGSQLILAFLVTRWPLSFNLIVRYEWLLSFTCCIGNLASTFLIPLSVAVFGGQCYRRDWLPYPNYNYLSWGYVFAILSMSVHLIAGLVLYGEGRTSKGRSLLNGQDNRHRHADSDAQSDMVMRTRTLSPTGTAGMYSYSAAGQELTLLYS